MLLAGFVFFGNLLSPCHAAGSESPDDPFTNGGKMIRAATSVASLSESGAFGRMVTAGATAVAAAFGSITVVGVRWLLLVVSCAACLVGLAPDSVDVMLALL